MKEAIVEKLLTPKELAQMLGMSLSSINRTRCMGGLDLPSYVKIGKSVRYKLSTVLKWIESLPLHNGPVNYDENEE